MLPPPFLRPDQPMRIERRIVAILYTRIDASYEIHLHVVAGYKPSVFAIEKAKRSHTERIDYSDVRTSR